jgi:predicted metal-dependent hydrolase
MAPPSGWRNPACQKQPKLSSAGISSRPGFSLTERVLAIAGKHAFRYQKIRISSARTRWGSCSSRGTLSFTYRLVMAPPDVVDYVVMHELVHTQVRNHSKTFWNKVQELMPDYKTRLAWLKKNGKYLM